MVTARLPTTVGSQDRVRAAREAVRDEYPMVRVGAAATLLKAGEIDEDFFSSLVVDLLRAARAAVGVAVDALVSTLYDLPPIGFVPRDYAERDRESLQTILQHPDPMNRIQRFTAATLDQASRDFQIEIGREHGATHWRWRADKESCAECLMKGDRVFSIDEQMVDHPNCECWPELIFKNGE